MSRNRKSNKKKIGAPVLHCLNPNAAGVGIGATEIYIAVPVDRDPRPVRHFPTFTEDLHAAAGQAYDETICAQSEVQNRRRLEARLRNQARELSLELVAM